jgi:hypothetical protein
LHTWSTRSGKTKRENEENPDEEVAETLDDESEDDSTGIPSLSRQGDPRNRHKNTLLLQGVPV